MQKKNILQNYPPFPDQLSSKAEIDEIFLNVLKDLCYRLNCVFPKIHLLIS